MVLGLYYLTMVRDNELGEGRAFGSIAEAIMAHDQGSVSLQAKIKIRLTKAGQIPRSFPRIHPRQQFFAIMPLKQSPADWQLQSIR